MNMSSQVFMTKRGIALQLHMRPRINAASLYLKLRAARKKPLAAQGPACFSVMARIIDAGVDLALTEEQTADMDAFRAEVIQKGRPDLVKDKSNLFLYVQAVCQGHDELDALVMQILDLAGAKPARKPKPDHNHADNPRLPFGWIRPRAKAR